MNGGGEFDHAKAGAQMPARHAHRGNHFLSQLVSKLAQLVGLQLAQVGRRMYLIKQGGDERWHFGHSSRSCSDFGDQCRTGKSDGLSQAHFAQRPSTSMTGRSGMRSEEHTSELQSLMRISYAVFCLKKKKTK